jgi:fluoride exporter
VLTLLVSVAAGAGAVLRYVADTLVSHRTRTPFPVGTLAVNLSGSLLLGLVTGLAMHHGLGGRATLVLGVGLTGGYTTMSTWAWETLALVEEGAVGLAVLNVVGSIALGMAAAACGLGLAQL